LLIQDCFCLKVSVKLLENVAVITANIADAYERSNCPEPVSCASELSDEERKKEVSQRQNVVKAIAAMAKRLILQNASAVEIKTRFIKLKVSG